MLQHSFIMSFDFSGAQLAQPHPYMSEAPPQAGPVVASDDSQEKPDELDSLFDYEEEAANLTSDEEDGEEQEADDKLFLSISHQLDARPDILERYLVATPTRFFKFLDRHRPLLRQYIKRRSRKQAEKRCSPATTQPSSSENISPTSSAPIAAAPPAVDTSNAIMTTRYVPPPINQGQEAARAVGGDGSYPYPPHRIATSLQHPAGDGSKWREYEEDACIRHMLDLKDSTRFKGEARFDETARRLQREGIPRYSGAVKNFWNRRGRVRSGFDERRRPNDVLATSQQPAKKRKADVYILDQPRQEHRNKRRSRVSRTPSVAPQMRQQSLQPQQQQQQQHREQYQPQQQHQKHQHQYQPQQNHSYMPPPAPTLGLQAAGLQMPANAYPITPARADYYEQQDIGSYYLPANYQAQNGFWNFQ